MTQETIEKTYALVDEILETETFKLLQKTKRAVEESSEVSPLIDAFNRAKINHDDAKKYGKHHPDLPRYKQALQCAKTELFTHPLIKEYKAREKALSDLLDDIALKLAGAISPRIAVDTANTFKRNGGLSSCKNGKV